LEGFSALNVVTTNNGKHIVDLDLEGLHTNELPVRFIWSGKLGFSTTC